MALSLFTIITIISIFLTLVLTVFFLVTRKGYPLENRLLSGLLLVFCLQIFYSFATSKFEFRFYLPYAKLLFMIRQTSLLLGPFIFLYSKAFLKKDKLRPVQAILHTIPFIGALLFLAIMLPGIPRFVIWESVFDFYDTLLILVHSLVYILLSIRLFLQHSQSSGNSLFNLLRAAPHPWLKTLLIGFVLVWVVNLNSFGLYMIVQRPGWCAYTASIYGLTVFLFINAIMFFMLLKPDMYYFTGKSRSARLLENEMDTCMQKVQKYMTDQKPYLNPDITLESLASELGMAPRTLSIVINDSLGKNFKTFILEYRIRESMEILAEPRNHRLTILEILYQVGFNSKSAFNNQFKLYTNLTPLEYRAQSAGSLRNRFRA